MDFTILTKSDKNMIITSPISIFKGEKNFDRLKFYFPSYCKNTIPTLQVILPDGKTGKVKACTFENELYKDYLIVYVDVIDALTAYAGNMTLWFTLFGETQEKTMKTGLLNIEVQDHEGFSSLIPDSDVGTDMLSSITELKLEVEHLKVTKADNLIVDNESSQLILKSGAEVIAYVDLPQEIEWSDWR